MTDVNKLTRRKLYDLVWQKPVDALAKEFGMSGRGLGKLCERHGIPVPPRGYWSRKAAGQKIKKPALVEPESDTQPDFGISIRIPPPSSNEPAPASQFIDIWRDQIQKIGHVEVPGALRKPHRIIANWLEADELARKHSKQNRSWSRGRFVSPHQSSLGARRLRILDTIFKWLQSAGFTVEVTRDGPEEILVSIGKDRVIFRLQEWMREYRRPITPEEASDIFYQGQKWRQIKEATGLLQFKITSYLPTGIPDRWREIDHSIEEKLPEILGALVTTVAYEAHRRSEAEAAERRRYQLAEQERKRAAEREAEKERREELRDQAQAWKEAADIRAFVAAVEQSVAAGGSFVPAGELRRWMAWALESADAIDPLRASDEPQE